MVDLRSLALGLGRNPYDSNTAVKYIAHVHPVDKETCTYLCCGGQVTPTSISKPFPTENTRTKTPAGISDVPGRRFSFSLA